MSVTDFYDFPEEYKAVLEEAKSVGRLEFYGKADFGSYVDRAVQKIPVSYTHLDVYKRQATGSLNGILCSPIITGLTVNRYFRFMSWEF